jgi:mannose-6-phosphate isomerase-like protein (cupin superfamily)
MAVAAKTGIDTYPADRHAQVAPTPTARLSFPCRPLDLGGQHGRPSEITIVVAPAAPRSGSDGDPCLQPRIGQGVELSAVAAFLADCAYDAVPLATLARMIGGWVLASGGAPGGAVDLALSTSRGERTGLRLAPRRFETEHTGFGAAHILHEDDILGLYVLEIAPGHAIPAHCHRVMREWELILDEGLLQQDRPVARGAAFAWPPGHVHAYRNPTLRSLRILCIDRPRFTRADEVPLIPAPPLAPLAPFAEYPV